MSEGRPKPQNGTGAYRPKGEADESPKDKKEGNEGEGSENKDSENK